MGFIHLPPLVTLARRLATEGQLQEFVETGTHLGNALPWASRQFRKVWTIEINRAFIEQAKSTHRSFTNVTFIEGDSASELPKVVQQLEGPGLFWLDAHAGGGAYGQEDNCPLLRELETVLASPHEHCIIVDDARAFLAPPPPPFDYRQWPSLDEIFEVIVRRGGYHAVSIAEVLIIVPRRLRPVVAEFCFNIRPKI